MVLRVTRAVAKMRIAPQITTKKSQGFDEQSTEVTLQKQIIIDSDSFFLHFIIS